MYLKNFFNYDLYFYKNRVCPSQFIMFTNRIVTLLFNPKISENVFKTIWHEHIYLLFIYMLAGLLEKN